MVSSNQTIKLDIDLIKSKRFFSPKKLLVKYRYLKLCETLMSLKGYEMMHFHRNTIAHAIKLEKILELEYTELVYRTVTL